MSIRGINEGVWLLGWDEDVERLKEGAQYSLRSGQKAGWSHSVPKAGHQEREGVTLGLCRSEIIPNNKLNPVGGTIMMKAAIWERYGGPEVVRVGEYEKPVPDDHQILVKIHAATVTRADCGMRQGPLLGRPVLGWTKPKVRVPGAEYAGEVESVGKAVTGFRPGDRVFGATGGGLGAHAEFIAVRDDEALATKPESLSFEESVSVIDGPVTAMHFLRDKGKVQPGTKVLINGASGGVGSAAVQVAKAFGGHVTGVCSTSNVDLVRSLGADEVVDYTKIDFTTAGQKYDLIFDTVGLSPFPKSKQALTDTGLYLSPVLAWTIFYNMARTSMGKGKKAMISFSGARAAAELKKDLLLVKELVVAGKLKPTIDRRYSLDEITDAHRYVDGGHKKGSVVITVR